jgi:predicted pyridoxine 5'-phosphate oxidase superfamily flavin-nucleotide-binding protein
MADEIYHVGERRAQSLAGEAERPERIGRSIRSTIPALAAAFLAERRMLTVAAADSDGRLWATLLSGPAGFLTVSDEHTLNVRARPIAEDPLAEVLAGSSARVGTIAVEPATRRRMRLNGRAESYRDGLRISADQVLSNCPKYIQRRHPIAATTPPVPGPARRFTALDGVQQSVVAKADTFFIASADAAGNADASHRGGNPGFVALVGPRRLRWPDYFGNGAFMTLGNLESNPSAGLLFPDWRTGDLLLLTGSARTDWSDRAVEFELDEGMCLPGAVPLVWSEPEYSPASP